MRHVLLLLLDMAPTSAYPHTQPPHDILMTCVPHINHHAENAATWFTNTDKVIHWLNQDGRVNAFYSTPSIYAAAKLETGKTYTLKTDDFMPYAGQ